MIKEMMIIFDAGTYKYIIEYHHKNNTHILTGCVFKIVTLIFMMVRIYLNVGIKKNKMVL